jgi:hypothetical protein
LRETVHRTLVGAIAAAVAFVVIGQSQIPNPRTQVASNIDGAGMHRRLKDGLGAKRPLNPVTIS